MLKLINRTNKTDFRIQAENRGITVNPSETTIPTWRAWSITDKDGKQWKILFTNHVGEFFVESVPTCEYDPRFRLGLYFKGQRILICQLRKNGRQYKDERYLRKYSDLALLVNNLVVYNYIRL